MQLQGPQISEFIDRLVRSLKAHEIPASPEQIIDSHDVALMLIARGKGTVDSDVLMHSLAPIYCANPAEQDVFYSDFRRALEPTGVEPEPEPVSPRRREPKPKRPAVFRWWKWSRRLTGVLAFALFMGVAVVVILELVPRPDVVDDTGTRDPIVTEPTDQTPPVIQEGQADDTIEILPRPPETIALIRPGETFAINASLWVIALIPLAIGFAALLRRIAGRRVFLRSDRTRSHPDLKPIPITEARVGLYAFSRLASAVTRMRLPKRDETRRLDARRTVEKTIDAGGFPSLVFETRSKRPGYVMLIERRNAIDFFAHAARSLADYLYSAGLEIHAFAFKGRPYRFIPLWRKGHRVTYKEILQKYHGDALVVAGEPGTIRRGNVAGANEWRPDLAAWSAAGLLSSNACETWDREEDWFLDKGFSVAAFGSDGFQEISSWLSAHEANDDDPHFVWDPSFDALFPSVLADNPQRWMTDDQQEDVEEMVAQLGKYLGDDGVYLFGAIAAYPDLSWPIARFLNQRLFPGENERLRSEERLLRIARLPWCREGRMPDYVRRAVIRSLDVEQREQVQSAFYKLVNDTHQEDPDGPTIQVAVPGSNRFKEFLREAFSTAPPGPYRDYVFQSVMLDKPANMLAVEVSRGRARSVGRQRWNLALPEILRQVRTSAIWALVAGYLAFAYLGPYFTDAVEQFNVNASGSLNARIFYYAEEAAAQRGSSIGSTEFLAERVRWALEVRGFNVSMETIEFAPAQTAAMLAQLETANAVQPFEGSTVSAEHPLSRPVTPNFVFFDGEAAISLVDQAVLPTRETLLDRASRPVRDFAAVIADDVSYATYGQPVRLSPAGDLDPNVLLAMGHPGEPAYIDGPSEINVLLIEGTRSFQDRVAKGAVGPVMTVVAPQPSGASFAMGKYEVTFDEYDRFARATERELPDDSGWGRERRPVINVSKSDAEAYAAWLSSETGEIYRLPTAAEWEYVARAGVTDSDTDTPAAGTAVFGRLSGGTLSVGAFAPNNWGLHDVQGNVAEWVEDCGPVGGPNGAPGVNRAGGCLLEAAMNGSWADLDVRLSTRKSVDPGTSNNTIGFRLLRETGRAPVETPDPDGNDDGESRARPLPPVLEPGLRIDNANTSFEQRQQGTTLDTTRLRQDNQANDPQQQPQPGAPILDTEEDPIDDQVEDQEEQVRPNPPVLDIGHNTQAEPGAKYG